MGCSESNDAVAIQPQIQPIDTPNVLSAPPTKPVAVQQQHHQNGGQSKNEIEPPPKPQPEPRKQEKKVEEPKKEEKKTEVPKIETKKSEALPDILKFEFLKVNEKMLSGKFSTQKGGEKDGPKINSEDCHEGVGVISMWYQNGCYTDGNYNHTNFLVEKGEVAGKEAYRVHPPSNKAKNFLGSRHCLIFKIGQQRDYSVYKFEENSLDLVLEIAKAKITPNSWNIIQGLQISELGKPIVYIIIPSNERLSPFAIIKTGIEGATIFKDSTVRIELLKLPLPVEPPVPQDFSHGPNSHYNCYNPNRNLYYVRSKGKDFLLWNDREKNSAYLTEIDRTEIKVNSVAIKSKTTGYELTGFCGNDDFFIFGQIQSGAASAKTGTRKMQLVQCGYNGTEKKRETVNTNKDNLNINSFDAGQLQLNGDSIGLIVSRKMTVSNDGLNHQGAYAAIFNASTLKSIKNFGQTSGHSFAHTLIPRKQGGFMGIDLGDNYPRAIHHWVFNETSIQFKKVYSFKTEHGGDAKSPAGATYPAYPQISKNGKKFFKWSNDNRTYTELAAPGIIDHASGNIIIFAGENQPGSLDNSKVGNYNNGPRNIGFVKTSKNLKEGILSKGVDETGGFFNFGGGWEVLKNQGIVWVTKLGQNENASRVKAVEVNNKICIIFELWSKDAYLNTQYMILDINGLVLTKNTVIPFMVRLHKSDDIYSTGSSIVIYSGSKGKVLNRYELFGL